MSAAKQTGVSFSLGRLMATPNALANLTQKDISTALLRHSSGDWGDVDDDDRRANEGSLRDGSRLWSVYHSESGTRFLVITEANRSAPTVLLPEDY